MSVERDIIDELDAVLANIRRAEQNIIGKDSPNKLKVVTRLVDLEETVKSIKNEIIIPTLDITEDTLIQEVQKEKLLLKNKAVSNKGEYKICQGQRKTGSF